MKESRFNYYKEFKRINRILDLDYSKLYDKYHDLELSHNRLESLLKHSKKCLDFCMANFVMPDSIYKSFMNLVIAINQELENPLYRVRERKKK